MILFGAQMLFVAGTLLFLLVTKRSVTLFLASSFACIAPIMYGVQTVPVPVMGGIVMLLFGAITVVGRNTLVKAGDDLSEPRNLTIVALILATDIGDMSLAIKGYSPGGIGLASIDNAGTVLSFGNR